VNPQPHPSTPSWDLSFHQPAARVVGAATPGVVVMGVAGCGKSSLGAVIAHSRGWPLLEGDDYHSAANRAKMRAGTPLTDADRAGWLAELGTLLASHHPCVLTCSALRRAYREQLRASLPGLAFVYMEIDEPSAQARVAARGGEHFFPASLVAAQFATLESPVGEDRVLRVDALQPLKVLVDNVTEWLR
jgi:gluconokinase